jgi:O-antigen ligase
MVLPSIRRDRVDQRATQIAALLVLFVPLALLHARAGAEILIGLIDGLFLVHCWAARDWQWRRRAFAIAAAAWWVWLTLCSALGSGGILLGLAGFRLPLFALALGEWVLLAPRRRRALWWLLAASWVWIALETWQQYLTGTNLFGQVRWMDGALTGPFNKPRAGPALILIFFPVLVPAVARLLARPGTGARAAGGFLALFGVATMILIGQRMPSLLLLLGLVLTALLMPRLRGALVVVTALGLALLAATPLISPETYDKLVLHFADQMRHFQASSYGLIFARALAMAAAHPVFGQGFDAFRRNCPASAGEACNIHPHNYYLEAADDGGLPLLVLFCLMVGAALLRLWTSLQEGANALRVGIFVAASVAFWPAASTSAFTSMPNAGWIFLCLGFGFTCADRAQ